MHIAWIYASYNCLNEINHLHTSVSFTGPIFPLSILRSIIIRDCKQKIDFGIFPIQTGLTYTFL